jgi:hypothetical protein
MANFIDKAKDIYYNNSNYQYNKSIRDALNLIKNYSVLKNYINSNIMNIEELLSIAEMQNFALKKKHSKMIKDFIKGVIEYYENQFFVDLRLPEKDRYIMSHNVGQNHYISFILSLFEVLTSIIEHQLHSENIYEITISRNKSEIRIIGFSFPDTDSYISYLFKSALISNNNLKSIDVICLDKEGSIEKKYKQIFCTDKFHFKNDNIGNYFDAIHKARKEYTDHSVTYAGKLEDVHYYYFNPETKK